jgi:hypothetical protein
MTKIFVSEPYQTADEFRGEFLECAGMSPLSKVRHRELVPWQK